MRVRRCPSLPAARATLTEERKKEKNPINYSPQSPPRHARITWTPGPLGDASPHDPRLSFPFPSALTNIPFHLLSRTPSFVAPAPFSPPLPFPLGSSLISSPFYLSLLPKCFSRYLFPSLSSALLWLYLSLFPLLFFSSLNISLFSLPPFSFPSRKSSSRLLLLLPCALPFLPSSPSPLPSSLLPPLPAM